MAVIRAPLTVLDVAEILLLERSTVAVTTPRPETEVARRDGLVGEVPRLPERVEVRVGEVG